MTNIIFLKDKMWEAAQKSDKKQFDDCCDKLIEKVYSDWWRIGWSICPKDIDDLLKLIDKTAKEAHKSWQKAVKNGDADIERMRVSYNERRRYLVKKLNEIGMPAFEPEGAFYIFPSIQRFGMTSEEFATRLLKQEKLAVVPGTAFGDSGEGFLRISYAYSMDRLKDAMGRIEHFISTLQDDA